MKSDGAFYIALFGIGAVIVLLLIRREEALTLTPSGTAAPYQPGMAGQFGLALGSAICKFGGNTLSMNYCSKELGADAKGVAQSYDAVLSAPGIKQNATAIAKTYVEPWTALGSSKCGWKGCGK